MTKKYLGFFLKSLTRRVSAGPSPLKIIAAQPPGDIHGFADRIEPRNAFGHHCLRRQPGGRDAAHGDLCLGETLGAVGLEGPALQARLGLYELAVGLRSQFAG